MFAKIKKKTVELLIWSSSHTHLDMLYFVSGGFWLSIAQFFSIVSSLVVSVVFANKLEPEIYGQYRYLMALVGVLGSLSLTGLGTALAQAVARGKEKTLLPVFQTQLVWSLPVTIIGLALGILAYFRGNLIYGWVFGLYFLTFPLSNAAGLYESFLNGKGAFSRSTKYFLLSSIAINVSLGISAYFCPERFLWLFPISFVLQLFFTFIFFRQIRSEINPRSPVDIGAVNYAKNLSLANIMAAVADQIDSLILFLVAGPQILAVYSLAIAAPEMAKGFFKMIAPLALPKLAIANWSEVQSFLPRHLARAFIVIIVPVIGYLLFAPVLFQWFFPKYQSAVIFSQVFSLSLIFTPLFLLISALQAQKKVRELYICSLLTQVVTIFLTVVLTIYYGIGGLIIARVTARMFNFFLLLRLTFQR